jgi:hypothetical protein
MYTKKIGTRGSVANRMGVSAVVLSRVLCVVCDGL